MGYLVFGDDSTTSFIGQVKSIPYTKPSIAIMYALAAQYLGMRALYLEAGSGSNHPMPPELVKAVRKHFKGLLIVGGGVTTSETATALARAGAFSISAISASDRSRNERSIEGGSLGVRVIEDDTGV